MPLIRKPSTEDLEDHFFGSGAFQYGWISYVAGPAGYNKFPVVLYDTSGHPWEGGKAVDENTFIEGIKKYAESLEDRSFDDLIEDMDAADVDNVFQLILFGEIRYA